MQQQSWKKKSWVTSILLVFLPFAACFVITSIFRTIDTVQEPFIVETLKLHIDQATLLTACYLLGHGIVQLPLGILLDDFDPKYIQVGLLLIATAATAIFAASHGIFALTFSRFLIGAGLAAGLPAAFKVNAEHFSEKQLPVFNTLVWLIGAIGAFLATEPAYHLFLLVGWRTINWGIAGITLLLCAYIALFVPRQHYVDVEKNLTQSRLKHITVVFRSSYFWRLTPFMSLCLGFFFAQQSLLAGFWLRDVAGFPAAQSAHCLYIFGIAILSGLIFTAILAHLAVRFSLSLTKLMLFGFVCTLLCEIGMVDGVHINHYLLWFSYGFFVQILTLSFTVISEYFHPDCAGRAVTALVFFAFLTSFIVQHGTGVILRMWPHSTDTFHPIAAYRVIYSIFIILQVLTAIWFIRGKKLLGFQAT